jgi:D-3-phosphoglycerate dehydrogenase
MLILISDAFDASLADKLSVFGEVTNDKQRLSEANVVLLRSKTVCTKEYIEQVPNLKLIIRGGVGIDNIDKEFAESKGIIVRNTPKSSSIAVAELVMAHLISAPTHIIEYHNGMKEGKWLKKQIKRTELYGKTLCLFGIGNIAHKVADRASAFGMKVVAYDKYVSSSDKAEMKATPELAIKDADYVSLHMPLTEETRGMINSKLIANCTRVPVVINTCRGPVVDADDMCALLEANKVALYCTDVYPSDPPSEDYVILKQEKVILTPHVGANTNENLLRIGDEAFAIIDELSKGGKL